MRFWPGTTWIGPYLKWRRCTSEPSGVRKPVSGSGGSAARAAWAHASAASKVAVPSVASPHLRTVLYPASPTRPVVLFFHLLKADVVVIGAGIAGLVTTLELLDAGRDVVLLDRCHPHEVGGLARE